MEVQSKSELIESRVDKGIANGLQITKSAGGVSFDSMGQAMEFSKLMSVSGQAVPSHCRNQPGVCLGIVVQAIEWRMSPYSVANKSYVVNDRLSYESQLIHAVIEQRAPITSRLRHEFSGAGESRKCKVWATARGESEPLVYESPEFRSITPKNSPLWKTKPDLQLFYNASRDWARMYFPDVILGVYADDELIDSEPVKQPQRITSLGDLVERLTPVVEVKEPETVVESVAMESELPAFSPDDLRAALKQCEDLTSVTAVEKTFLPLAKTDADHATLAGECEAAREAIRASRGGKK